MNLVTGGTGFVGAHVVRALLDRGEAVRCLVRHSSRLENLRGLAVETVTGDLTDPDSLARAVRGADRVFHCAADYRLFCRDSADLYRHNVDGTRNLLRAAADAGVGTVVYTSSVGALGLRPDGAPADEATPVSLERVVGHYKRSKFLAERVAEEWARQGLHVVIVNPSTPVGELDIKPTPTGKIIVDFLNRKMVAYVDTGMNLVDVRDVATGHLLAAQKGRSGEKYILGHVNLTLKQIFDLLAGITGIPSPKLRVPHWLPSLAAAVQTGWARLAGGEPAVSLESVRMSRHRMFFDASKAVRQLGLPQTPVEEPLQRAVEWFRGHGYVHGAT